MTMMIGANSGVNATRVMMRTIIISDERINYSYPIPRMETTKKNDLDVNELLKMDEDDTFDEPNNKQLLAETLHLQKVKLVHLLRIRKWIFFSFFPSENHSLRFARYLVDQCRSSASPEMIRVVP